MPRFAPPAFPKKPKPARPGVPPSGGVAPNPPKNIPPGPPPGRGAGYPPPVGDDKGPMPGMPGKPKPKKPVTGRRG